MPPRLVSALFRYSHTIGRGEMAGPGFRHPVAIALGEGGRMYVVNRGYDYRRDSTRVTICTVGEDYIGEFAKGNAFTQESTTDVPLVWPTSITLDHQGAVYVADEWLNHISIFTSDGESLHKWGKFGHEDGELDGPSGIAFNGDDNLYLVDSRNNRIQKFTKDGRFLCKWGSEGNNNGDFMLPWGVDVDRKGDVYVADWGNDRIQKFSSQGQFLMKFGCSGTLDGEFNRPSGVAVDNDGVIYVADWGNHRLQIFDENGNFITKIMGEATISKWGKLKLDANSEMWNHREAAYGLEREKLFWGPVAVEVDDQGRIFVAESARGRIQVYRKQAPPLHGSFL